MASVGPLLWPNELVPIGPFGEITATDVIPGRFPLGTVRRWSPEYFLSRFFSSELKLMIDAMRNEVNNLQNVEVKIGKGSITVIDPLPIVLPF